MPSFFYIPMLRAKQGEIEAIARISPRALASIRPFLDIPLLNPDDSRSMPQFLSEIVTKLRSAWGTKYPLYWDMSRYAPDVSIDDGRHPVELMFDYARQNRLQAIPVTGPEIDRGPTSRYLDSIATTIPRQRLGAAVRIQYEDMLSIDSFSATLNDTITQLKVNPRATDLLLDLGGLERLPVGPDAEYNLAQTIRAALSRANPRSFRSITLCGSSIPSQVGQKYNINPCRRTRVELRVWRALVSDMSLPLLLFGDYGVISPFQTDAGGAVRPPSRIRLSTETEHVLYRSRPESYRELRARVSGDEAIKQQSMSWGKKAILGRGHGFTGPGGPSDWVARDTNAHVETTMRIVARQLRKAGRMTGLDIAVPKSTPWLQEVLEMPGESIGRPTQ